jgi:hypothetical protein
MIREVFEKELLKAEISKLSESETTLNNSIYEIEKRYKLVNDKNIVLINEYQMEIESLRENLEIQKNELRFSIFISKITHI